MAFYEIVSSHGMLSHFNCLFPVANSFPFMFLCIFQVILFHYCPSYRLERWLMDLRIAWDVLYMMEFNMIMVGI